jgi:hypothetical protein
MIGGKAMSRREARRMIRAHLATLIRNLEPFPDAPDLVCDLWQTECRRIAEGLSPDPQDPSPSLE